MKNSKWQIVMILLPVFGFLISMTFGRFNFFENTVSHEMATMVFWKIRFPRTMLAFFVGGILGVSGCVLQGIFRNPLASPDIIGISSGASLGAAISIIFFSGNLFFTQAFAFLGGVLAVVLVLRIGSFSRSGNITHLVLSGLLVNLVAQAGVTMLKYVADPFKQLPLLEFWLMGSLNQVRSSTVYYIIPVALIGSFFLIAMRWQVNLLSLGQEEASMLGVSVKKIRFIMITIVTFLVAFSVSLCGIIGWVGLVAPHLVRLAMGDNHEKTIPLSFASGATILLLADTAARSISTTELPVSVIMAFIGAPTLFGLLWKVGK